MGRFLLTAVELEVLWGELSRVEPGLDRPPAVLRLPSPGRTDDERRQVRAAAGQALRGRGLAGPTGAHPGLAQLLRVLARPAEQLELRACWGGRVRAVAARREGIGALAVRRADTVLVTRCDSLPVGVLGALPPGRAGGGRASTVPSRVLAAAAVTSEPISAPTGSALMSALVARRIPAAEARLLVRMLGPVERRAQVVGLAESGPGGLRRRGGVVGLLDGPCGRYLVTRRTGPDGIEWTTVAPGSPRRIRYRITELLLPECRWEPP